MTLTATAITKAKPAARPFKMTDGGGLYLFVKPNGSKLWRLDYSVNRVRKTLSLGPFDTLSLADARLKREELKKRLREGFDPSVLLIQEKREAIMARGATLAEVCDEFIEFQRKDGLAPATIHRNKSVLRRAVQGRPLGKLPIREVHPADILSVMRSYETKGQLDTARRVRAVLSQVWKFAIVNLKAESDPTAVLKGATLSPKVKHFAAITDEARLGKLLRDIDDFDGSMLMPVRLGLKFLALTFVRPGEVRAARWADIDFNKRVWNIPAESMKMRRPHAVPLSPQSLAVLQEARQWCRGSEYVFPTFRSPKNPLAINALPQALRKLGYGSDEMTAHGFRSSASTILNMRKHPEEIIEIQLAHVNKDRVRAIYNRNEYWAERVKLMNDWADLLDEFRSL